MNRRNFFKKLSGAIAGVYVACHVKLPEIPEINPAWHNAEYDLFILSSPDVLRVINVGPPPIIPIIYKRLRVSDSTA